MREGCYRRISEVQWLAGIGSRLPKARDGAQRLDAHKLIRAVSKHKNNSRLVTEEYIASSAPAALAASAWPALGRKVSVTAAANWREHGAFLEPDVVG